MSRLKPVQSRQYPANCSYTNFYNVTASLDSSPELKIMQNWGNNRPSMKKRKCSWGTSSETPKNCEFNIESIIQVIFCAKNEITTTTQHGRSIFLQHHKIHSCHTVPITLQQHEKQPQNGNEEINLTSHSPLTLSSSCAPLIGIFQTQSPAMLDKTRVERWDSGDNTQRECEHNSQHPTSSVCM